jgi:hypothetical protein
MKTIFKLFLLTCSFSYIFTSCRKENLREINGTFVNGPISCFNGILDPGELFVDCGGPCAACSSEYYPPCDNQENRAVTTDGSFDLTVTNTLTFGQYRIIRGTFNNGNIEVFFNGPQLATGIYELTSSTFPSTDEVGFQYQWGFAEYSTNNGVAYVYYVGNELTIEVCNLTTLFAGQSKTVSANLTITI